ncbi:hypothetical protein [Janthinobacterium sp. BJB446]|uniref:hypothetical protein n=1 Tax=Janthinobacterium sp. BJB446 TaxID=2048009 RepID=UPI0015D4F643|nr:hypothetical protein [Janthinobacterium sp. BJB446]
MNNACAPSRARAAGQGKVMARKPGRAMTLSKPSKTGPARKKKISMELVRLAANCSKA